MNARLGTATAWAVFSDDSRVGVDPSDPPDDGGARYRYELGRIWDPTRPILVWLMLNPSTATHEKLDPTLERCEEFSRAFGYGGFVIVNMYAFRAKDPKSLPRMDRRPSARAVGPENDAFIELWVSGRDVLVGWGKHCSNDRVMIVSALLARAANVDCLLTNGDGSPTHPLYIKGTTPRKPWRSAA